MTKPNTSTGPIIDANLARLKNVDTMNDKEIRLSIVSIWLNVLVVRVIVYAGG